MRLARLDMRGSDRARSAGGARPAGVTPYLAAVAPAHSLTSAVLAILMAALALYLGQFATRNATKAGVTIEPGQIQVIDGDTIRANGQVYRLVGFDAPESGLNAKCESERTLAARATSRLRQIVAAGGLGLDRVPCACPAGTEGTQRCNYGRLCAVLTSAGRDVGAVLIGEGLARQYVCSDTRCPRRQGWC
jgi:endonuclease YncB( thermonuclease family)